MNLHRIKLIALTLGGIIAVSIPMGAAAHAATSANSASHRPATSAVGCTYFNADLGYRYYEADKDRALDWTARSGGISGSAVVLEPVSGRLNTDCFHLLGFGNNQFEFKLANTELCLNIAGNSSHGSKLVKLAA